MSTVNNTNGKTWKQDLLTTSKQKINQYKKKLGSRYSLFKRNNQIFVDATYNDIITTKIIFTV